jgi:hypothetical protein
LDVLPRQVAGAGCAPANHAASGRRRPDAPRARAPSDLSQLLVGRFESGAATEHDLEAIQATLLPAYYNGLAEEGVDADPQRVESGWAIALAVRSVFSALLLDHRSDLDENARAELLAGRAAACRFGLDLALQVANRIA